MVCSEKTQKLLRSRKSGTNSAQVRSLDDLPMKWNKTDSMRAAAKCRSTMSAHSAQSTQAQRTSHSMLTQSRRLFEDAFERAKTSPITIPDSVRLPPVPLRDIRTAHSHREDAIISLRETMRSSCSLRSQRSTRKHTGPTAFGSPLYNSGGSQPVLDRINSKPLLSEPPPEYFRATPDIQKCLKQSNELFRVTKALCTDNDYQDEAQTSRTHDSFSHFILVPNRQNGSKSGSASMPKPALKPVSNLLKENYSDESDTVSVNERIPHIRVDEYDDVIVETSKPSEQEAKESISPRQEENLQPKVSDKSLLPTSKVSREKPSALKSPQTSPRIRQNKVTINQKEKKTKKKGKLLKEEGEEEQDEESIMEPDFPGFICPSSETKSCEAYIRHWIRQNTFTKCNRFVPLD